MELNADGDTDNRLSFPNNNRGISGYEIKTWAIILADIFYKINYKDLISFHVH